MITRMHDVVVCSTPNCDFIFGPYPRGMEPEEQRVPCPKCGSSNRTVRKYLQGEITPLGSLNYDGFPSGTTSKRRRFVWGFTGWDVSKRLGRLVRKVSLFDKRSDRRYE